MKLNYIIIATGTIDGGFNAEMTVRTQAGATWKRMQFMDKDLTKLGAQIKRAIVKLESEFKA